MLITPSRIPRLQHAARELQVMNLTPRRSKTSGEILAKLEDMGKVEGNPESRMIAPNRLHQPQRKWGRTHVLTLNSKGLEGFHADPWRALGEAGGIRANLLKRVKQRSPRGRPAGDWPADQHEILRTELDGGVDELPYTRHRSLPRQPRS
jgi:hypothetical protein